LDGHLINWSVFAARAWDTLSMHLLTVPLSTPIVSLTTCRKLPDAKYLKAMRTTPNVDEPSFVNRKGHHSLNVQTTCDHEGMIVFNLDILVLGNTI
jgi:hypothetical protein